MSDSIDLVNAPPHYTSSEVECIDYIKQQLGEAYRYYLEGAAIKYLHRFKYKGKEIEDLKKHQWYISKLIEEIQRQDTQFEKDLMTEAEKFIE
tara:strand:- start:1957 stop:2235 length:279 start_codon:yes stop_codon:yes gene_type:complete